MFFSSPAKKLGFSEEEVERDTPQLNNDGTFDSFAREKVMKYSCLHPGAPFGDWQLLQRFPAEGSALPNGFVVTGANVTPELLERLLPLAHKYGDDYFEFERKGEVISVYTWEAGKSTLEHIARSIILLEA